MPHARAAREQASRLLHVGGVEEIYLDKEPLSHMVAVHGYCAHDLCLEHVLALLLREAPAAAFLHPLLLLQTLILPQRLVHALCKLAHAGMQPFAWLRGPIVHCGNQQVWEHPV